MKNKILITTTIIFFLIINTSYFWVDKIGILGFLIIFPLLAIYCALLIVLIVQLCFAIKEKFKEKFRVFNIGLLTFVLILTFLFPTGVINFEKFESKDLIIEGREGCGGCNSTIKLKEDLTFIKKEVCFGMEKKKGTYQISNDTIYFFKGKESLGYTFAIIQESKYIPPYPILTFFKNKNDTIGYSYRIFKNDLKSNQQIIK
jgi:phosphate/sulfate permease